MVDRRNVTQRNLSHSWIRWTTGHGHCGLKKRSIAMVHYWVRHAKCTWSSFTSGSSKHLSPDCNTQHQIKTLPQVKRHEPSSPLDNFHFLENFYFFDNFLFKCSIKLHGSLWALQVLTLALSFTFLGYSFTQSCIFLFFAMFLIGFQIQFQNGWSISQPADPYKSGKG